MSFLGDIVSSIGGDKVPAPPKPPNRPLSANAARPSADPPKSFPRVSSQGIGSHSNGTKRKAEDVPTRVADKIMRPSSTSGSNPDVVRRPGSLVTTPSSHQNEKTSASIKTSLDKPASTITKMSQSSAGPGTTTAPGKLPVKGSYADIMARAKQAAEQKVQNQVGLIKHQASNRDKVSKFAERKREEQERAKNEKPNNAARTESNRKPDRKRSASPVKKSDNVRGPKVPKPPLHGPQPTYKGTMGRASNRAQSASRNKRRRYDEYLGTDEEEDSEVGDYDEDSYGSDASSNMEAGAFELDEEERRALKAARDDDAKELALENRLKREKEEKRKQYQSRER